MTEHDSRLAPGALPGTQIVFHHRGHGAEPKKEEVFTTEDTESTEPDRRKKGLGSRAEEPLPFHLRVLCGSSEVRPGSI
jgi:hypothetical protein